MISSFLQRFEDLTEQDGIYNEAPLSLTCSRTTPSLTIKCKKIPITPPQLYILLLSKTLHLERPLQHYIDTKDPRMQHILAVFENTDNESHLTTSILTELTKAMVNNRRGVTAANQMIPKFKNLIFDTWMHAIQNCHLTLADLQFFCLFVETIGIFADFISTEKFAKMQKFIPQPCYKPWLVVIKDTMLKLETNYQQVLDDLELVSDMLSRVETWLLSAPIEGLIKWLAEFLFREEYDEAKRMFLLIQGEPNTGKTFFLHLLFNSADFLTKNMTTDYYAAVKAGTYILHALIYDDPSSTQKHNKISSEFFLNAARNFGETSALNLPVKYGHMTVHKAQIIFASNYSLHDLFSPQATPGLQTRFTTIDFNQAPFPLQCSSKTTTSFLLRDDQPQLPQDDDLFVLCSDCQKLPCLCVIQLVTKPESDSSHQLMLEKLDQNLMFYFLWRGILKVLGTTFSQQTKSTLNRLIPDLTLQTNLSDLWTYLKSLSTEDLNKALHSQTLV